MIRKKYKLRLKHPGLTHHSTVGPLLYHTHRNVGLHYSLLRVHQLDYGGNASFILQPFYSNSVAAQPFTGCRLPASARKRRRSIVAVAEIQFRYRRSKRISSCRDACLCPALCFTTERDHWSIAWHDLLNDLVIENFT